MIRRRLWAGLWESNALLKGLSKEKKKSKSRRFCWRGQLCFHYDEWIFNHFLSLCKHLLMLKVGWKSRLAPSMETCWLSCFKINWAWNRRERDINYTSALMESIRVFSPWGWGWFDCVWAWGNCHHTLASPFLFNPLLERRKFAWVAARCYGDDSNPSSDEKCEKASPAHK